MDNNPAAGPPVMYNAFRCDDPPYSVGHRLRHPVSANLWGGITGPGLVHRGSAGRLALPNWAQLPQGTLLQ